MILADTGRPVAGAEVSILGRTATARTDAAGRFVLRPDPVPPFEILVVLPGERYLRPILVERIPEDGPLDVAVVPVIMESVTVTGAAPDVESAPAAGTTLVSHNDIETRQPANLTQALENVPGVSQVSEGQAAVPAIRGLARGRTLILIDGARVTSERRVGPSATYMDPFALEGIEVARGPGSVAYGSDAFGGVIDARTRRPAPGAPLAIRFVGSLGAGVPQQRAGVEVSRGLGEGGVLFQGHFRNLDDYRSPGGTVFNSASRDGGWLARWEQAAGPGLLSVGWQSDLGRDIERPRNNSRTTRFYYPTEDSHRFTASYDSGPVWGLNRLTLSSFVGSYHVVTDQDRFTTAAKPRRIERADVDANDFHVRTAGEKLVGKARIQFGADVNGRFDLEAEDVYVDFDADGHESEREVIQTIENAVRTDAGLFVMAEGAIHPRVSLAGGARVDRVTTRNDGGYFGDRSTANSALSGYAAATFDSSKGVNLTLQIARGFRDPVLSDRYFRGVTGRGFITGNPDLEPETSLQFDTALRYTAGRWRVAGFYYEYRIDDLIERYQTDPDFFFFRNRGRARLRGVELEGQGELGHRLSLQVSGQIQRGRVLDDDTPMDDIAPGTLSIQLRREIGSRGFAQVRTAFYAKRDDPGPTEVATPGYWLLDAAGGWKLADQAELRILLRNLLDREYPVSPDARAVPAPGISGLLTFVLKL
ncbi:MAG: TonB-dependent receptor [Acidobacteriota bacterium]